MCRPSPSVTIHSSCIRPGRASSTSTDRPTDRCDAMRCVG
jgi:hypothetical protein